MIYFGARVFMPRSLFYFFNLHKTNRSEILWASWHHCSRAACQISNQSEQFNSPFCGCGPCFPFTQVKLDLWNYRTYGVVVMTWFQTDGCQATTSLALVRLLEFLHQAGTVIRELVIHTASTQTFSNLATSTDWKERKKIKVARRYFIKWKFFLLRSVANFCKSARCP